jgi:hypothetical protein
MALPDSNIAGEMATNRGESGISYFGSRTSATGQNRPIDLLMAYVGNEPIADITDVTCFSP